MFITMKSVWGDLKQLKVVVHNYMNRKRRVHGNTGITPVVDLNAGNGSSEWMQAGNDRFEEIDLKSDLPRGNTDAVDK